MPLILVDILPAKGHFYGSLKMIQILRDAGYQIIYLNMNSLKSELEKYGFQTRSHASFIVNPVLLNKQRFNFKLFIDRYLIRRIDFDKSLQSNFQIFKNFLDELSPNLVLLDEQNMLKAIYYKSLGIPVVCIETKPEPEMTFNVPPFTSSYVPSDTKFSRSYCELLWALKIAKNYFRLKKKQLNNCGQDDYSTAVRFAKGQGEAIKNGISTKRSYGFGIKGIPRIILSPVDFDFPRVEKNNTHGIGPLIDVQREGEIEKPRYNALIKNLQTIKQAQKGKVIYCSMGTITGKFSKHASRFFRNIMEVARLNGDDLFVLGTGDHCDINDLVPVPDNVYVFRSVPQVDLLKYTDIMVTHGGINSITECIFHGIPTLNYPLSHEWDQPGCAARATYHKVGLSGNLRHDSVKVISKKLNRLKSNYLWYRQNALSMRDKFEKKNQSTQVLEIIQNILEHD